MGTSNESLVILADDLTGAADCAARCRGAGLPATICVEEPMLPLPAGAVALTSDSRHLSAAEAADRVRALLVAFKTTPAQWYKKIDSTLRGHIGAELEAMLDALECTSAIVCPAFPAQGRGLEGGYLVAATHTERVHVPTLLAQQSAHPVQAIPLSLMRAGPVALAQHLSRASQQGSMILVVDALSEEDLDTLVTASQGLPATLLCGSAGLVGALATRYKTPRLQVAAESGGSVPSAHTGGVLVVVGSGSQRAREQIAYARQMGISTQQMGCTTLQGSSGDLLLHLPEPEGAALEGPAARETVRRLADAAVTAIKELQPATLVLTGGDTAISVVRRLGIRRLEVLQEVLPGMPLAWGCDAQGNGYRVILKAGNHGDRTALASLVQFARAAR